MDTQKCLLKYCPGKLSYYDGGLGYEAMVCGTCKSHYTGRLTININEKQYTEVVRRYKK